MPGGKPKLALSRAELVDAADKLSYLAKRFQDLAEMMEITKTDSIEAGNVKMLRISVGHLVGAVNAANLAYDRARVQSGVFAKEKPRKK